MSQQQGVYHAEASKKGFAERLLKMFSPQQADELADAFEEVCFSEHGGDVYVVFRNQHPVESQPRKYRKFSKPAFE
jgi:hypothetical protein